MTDARMFWEPEDEKMRAKAMARADAAEDERRAERRRWGEDSEGARIRIAALERDTATLKDMRERWNELVAERDAEKARADAAESALRLNLAVAPDDPLLLTPNEKRIAELEKRNRAALELIDDLRHYARDWEWKYGGSWDSQRKEALGDD